jgi:IS1 family transposase
MANVLSDEKRLRVLAALVDGNSERATARIADVEANTVSRFVLRFGERCGWLHNRLVRGLSCSLVELDEQWSYIKKKQARVTEEDGPEVGEAWTWVAVDPTSQLTIAFNVGKRTEDDAKALVADLRARLVLMPRLLTSDGLAAYVEPIWASFGPAVTYGQVIKNYRKGASRGPDHRYEPPRDPFLTKKAVYGTPDLGGATTAHVERNNLTTRHFNGRMRRLCLAFSKKLENHKAAMALGYTYRNFCWVPRNLRITPAMAAGITDHVWDLAEFMEAALSAAPCEPPAAAPLAILAPPTTARELPNGRGFLRVVPSGSGPPPAPPSTSSPVVAPVVGPPAVAAAAPAPPEQLDLLSWARPPCKPAQLGLFDE